MNIKSNFDFIEYFSSYSTFDIRIFRIIYALYVEFEEKFNGEIEKIIYLTVFELFMSKYA